MDCRRAQTSKMHRNKGLTSQSQCHSNRDCHELRAGLGIIWRGTNLKSAAAAAAAGTVISMTR